MNRFKSLSAKNKRLVIIGVLFTSLFCCLPIIVGKDTPTTTPVAQISFTPTKTVTPSPTVTPSTTPTPSRTPTPTNTSTPTQTLTPSITPLATIPGVHSALCIPRGTQQEVGVVIQVIDGDTIVVRLDDGDYRVRYIGIDTPEQNEPGAAQATNENSRMVAWKTVTLVRDVSNTDQYGRLLRYVLVEKLFVNYQLVRIGVARAVDYPPDTACASTFHTAEKQAISDGVGRWAPTPTFQPATSGGSTGGAGAVVAPAGCTCSPPDLDCKDFGTHNNAQACFEYCKSLGRGDYYRLDGDNDGKACESLP